MIMAKVPKDCDLRSLDGEQSTDGRELDDLRGGSLFGKGTFLAVRRGHGWLKQHGASLAVILPKMAAGCGVLLEVPKLDRRTKLAKALASSGELFEFRDLYTEPYDRTRSPLEAEFVAWIAQRAKGMSCPLTLEAAYLLMTSVGTQPAEVLAELQRIATAVGPTVGKVLKALTPQDLQGKLTCSFESTPFEFAEALLARDRRRASRALTALYRRGARSKDGSTMDRGGLFPFVTSWLYQSAAQVYEGRLLLDEGMPLRDIAGRLGVRVFVDRFIAQVRANSAAQMRQVLQELLACQRNLRSSGEDPELLLERLVANLLPEAAA